MRNTANKQIREAAKEAGVLLWEIAERYGINDGNFSRKLRRELNSQELDKIMAIIREISAERSEAV